MNVILRDFVIFVGNKHEWEFLRSFILIALLGGITLLQFSLCNLAVNAQGFKAIPHYLVLPIHLISKVKLPSYI